MGSDDSWKAVVGRPHGNDPTPSPFRTATAIIPRCDGLSFGPLLNSAMVLSSSSLGPNQLVLFDVHGKHMYINDKIMRA